MFTDFMFHLWGIANRYFQNPLGTEAEAWCHITLQQGQELGRVSVNRNAREKPGGSRQLPTEGRLRVENIPLQISSWNSAIYSAISFLLRGWRKHRHRATEAQIRMLWLVLPSPVSFLTTWSALLPSLLQDLERSPSLICSFTFHGSRYPWSTTGWRY